MTDKANFTYSDFKRRAIALRFVVAQHHRNALEQAVITLRHIKRMSASEINAFYRDVEHVKLWQAEGDEEGEG